MESLTTFKAESWLSWFLRGILVLGFLFLAAKLLELQVIKGNYFRSLAEGNRVKRVAIAAPRGKVLARGGEILVGNSEEGESEWRRDYVLGESFAHVSGYLGEASEGEVGKINPKCPEKGPVRAGQFIGRSGLEGQYDCILAGTDGEELLEVDTFGEKVRVLGRKVPTPGRDIKTYIDFGMQRKVAEIFKGKKGAVIVSEPSGEILALYSAPSYDPTNVAKYLKDASLPLYNRAIGGLFHPGSVFKPVIAIAALSEGRIDENFLYDDPGVIKVGDKFSYANWYFTQYGRVEGRIDIKRAIARSTDTFFYKLGEELGIEKVDEWAKNFGLDTETGIDIPGELPGLVPTPEWKLRVKGEPWFLGNTYHISIGQGDLALTPIGINAAISTVANGGALCTPKIVQDKDEERCKSLKIERKILGIVKEGMESACTSGGTGFTFFDFEIKSLPAQESQQEAYTNSIEKPNAKTGRVACKTGTAETNEDGKTHAWFVVFGPLAEPEIVTTVLVEGGGEGSSVAGPIARQIFDYWFHP